MLELYKNIKLKRIELNMTQTELANKTGYTNKSSIASIEAGKIDLPQSKISEFAKALECTPAELMGWSIENPKLLIEKEPQSELQHKAIEHYIKYLSMDERTRKAIDSLLGD